MMKSIVKPTLVLTLIAAVVAALLAITYNVAGIADLGKSIEPAKLEEYKTLATPTAKKLALAKVEIESESFLGAYKDEASNSIAIHFSADGYGGKDSMKLFVGFDPEGKISGTVVIENAETPNLGSKALDEEYLKQFVGRTRDNIAVGKAGTEDIDAIAGATISSRSVGEAFLRAYDFYDTVKEELL